MVELMRKIDKSLNQFQGTITTTNHLNESSPN